MEVKKRLYTVDDVLDLQGWDGTRDRKYELIDGELIEMSPANLLHAWLASRLDRKMGNFAEERELGYSFVEGGFLRLVIDTTCSGPMSPSSPRPGCLILSQKPSQASCQTLPLR